MMQLHWNPSRPVVPLEIDKCNKIYGIAEIQVKLMRLDSVYYAIWPMIFQWITQFYGIPFHSLSTINICLSVNDLSVKVNTELKLLNGE